jgi:hypothetical protein
MPAHDPFTKICMQLAAGPRLGRADLHMHTTCSDGTYTPAQVVDLAKRSGLAAIAITDHDTLAGLSSARAAAEGSRLEVISGVEITTEYRERELHLLAYFVDPEEMTLKTALARICRGRVERFLAMIERLRQAGVSIDESKVDLGRASLGRRYLAEVLVAQGQAGSIREAFQRWLIDAGKRTPNNRLPVAEAIKAVRKAGGVASWAHPTYDEKTRDSLIELKQIGLGAVEVEYPDFRRSQMQQLRVWAGQLQLAISGGSDCHGPGRRSVGSCTISDEELARLRREVANVS